MGGGGGGGGGRGKGEGSIMTLCQEANYLNHGFCPQNNT